MTRINSAIKVSLLTDEHLLAEHRECKRIPSSYIKRRDGRKGLVDLPKLFTLDTGHVLFFVDKGMFTYRRYLEIHHECLQRGFNVQDYSTNWEVYDGDLKDYFPTPRERVILTKRIIEKILNSPKDYWHYYGERISKDAAIKLLNKPREYILSSYFHE